MDFRDFPSEKPSAAVCHRVLELFFGGARKKWYLQRMQLTVGAAGLTSVENPLTFVKFEPTSRSITGSIIVLYPLLTGGRSFTAIRIGVASCLARTCIILGQIGTHYSTGFRFDSGLQRTRRG